MPVNIWERCDFCSLGVQCSKSEVSLANYVVYVCSLHSNFFVCLSTKSFYYKLLPFTSNTICTSIEMLYYFLIYSINVVNYIYWFLNVKLTLHFSIDDLSFFKNCVSEFVYLYFVPLEFMAWGLLSLWKTPSYYLSNTVLSHSLLFFWDSKYLYVRTF